MSRLPKAPTEPLPRVMAVPLLLLSLLVLSSAGEAVRGLGIEHHGPWVSAIAAGLAIGLTIVVTAFAWEALKVWAVHRRASTNLGN
jgi:hypothetical protein